MGLKEHAVNGGNKTFDYFKHRAVRQRGQGQRGSMDNDGGLKKANQSVEDKRERQKEGGDECTYSKDE